LAPWSLQIDSGEDAQEEFGWKLVHGDVFRPPRKGMMLAVCLGSGTQILCMTAITLVSEVLLTRYMLFYTTCGLIFRAFVENSYGLTEPTLLFLLLL
jgi:hypothetical protein